MIRRLSVRLHARDYWGNLWLSHCPCCDMWHIHQTWDRAMAEADEHAQLHTWPGEIEEAPVPF